MLTLILAAAAPATALGAPARHDAHPHVLRRRRLAEERMERFLERVLAALLPDHGIRRHHHHHRLAPRVPYGVWDRLAMCETGGDWRWGSQFAEPAYEGGIGFATSTWLAYRLPGYPLEAWRATRDEQIAVGRRVLAAVGPGAWGCAAVAGLEAGS